MLAKYFTPDQRRTWPYLAILAILAIAALKLHSQGRSWQCSCGRVLLWAGDVWSSDNSQHLFDPYSFTHLLHGVALCGLLALSFPHLRVAWRLWIAIFIEASWEVIENSDFIIQRYREATAALGYQGDTIINSMGDILACGLGFALARYLGFRLSLAVFVITEAVLLVWIRDSFILNIVMLIYSVDSIKAWQAGH